MPNIRRRIWALIKKIQQDGTTIFLTTHYIEEAEFLADRVALLDNGRIAAVDTPAVLMGSVGQWAVDWVTHEGMETAYFPSRQAAQASGAMRNGGFTLRRVNREDAFLSLTGKKVVKNTGHHREIHDWHGHAHGSHGHDAHANSAHGKRAH